MGQWAIGPLLLWLMKLAGPPRGQVVAPSSGAIPRLEEEGREGEQWEERVSPAQGLLQTRDFAQSLLRIHTRALRLGGGQ